MNKRVSKSLFKARALEYMREIQETGATLVITDRGHPVLSILPFREEEEHAREALLGSVSRYDSPTDPVDTEAWEASH
jgi:antitoxin (DNA-binding transcriptional repressor) of toxin-antitoxin stability system